MKRQDFFRFISYLLFILSISQTSVFAFDKETKSTLGVQTEYLQPQVVDMSESILSRSMGSSFIVSLVLLTLIFLSVLTWAVFLTKWLYFRKIKKNNKEFCDLFWSSRSLKDLYESIDETSYSPVREVFRSCYVELLKANRIRPEESFSEIRSSAVLGNLNRCIYKQKREEQQNMEKYLSILSISAAASPFIGLFGTVWGIMGSFEGIARTGSSSLFAVAPGISEALIATAFGLAAAIPAVIGFNYSNHKIRAIFVTFDSFSAELVNIVQRYLLSGSEKISEKKT